VGGSAATRRRVARTQGRRLSMDLAIDEGTIAGHGAAGRRATWSAVQAVCESAPTSPGHARPPVDLKRLRSRIGSTTTRTTISQGVTVWPDCSGSGNGGPARGTMVANPRVILPRRLVVLAVA